MADPTGVPKEAVSSPMDKVRQYQALFTSAAELRHDSTVLELERRDWEYGVELDLVVKQVTNQLTGKPHTATSAHSAMRANADNIDRKRLVAAKTLAADVCEGKARALGYELRMISAGME